MQQLIKINEEHYIIIDDSEIKEGFCYNLIHKVIVKPTDLEWTKSNKDNLKVITHSTIGHMYQDNIKSISLSEVEELINGYSVEKMFLEWESKNGNSYNDEANAFEAGFKAHQELVKNNLFSLEFLTWIDKEEVTYKDGSWIKYFDGKDNYLSIKELYSYYKSLLPKTEWEVEFDENNKITLL